MPDVNLRCVLKGWLCRTLRQALGQRSEPARSTGVNRALQVTKKTPRLCAEVLCLLY